MPSPKSGVSQTLVSPAAPRGATPADVADPGESDAARAAGPPFPPPFKSVDRHPVGGAGDGGDGAPAPTAWVEIQLLDLLGRPVPGEPYRVTAPDGSVTEGTLGADGVARVSGVPPGSCNITFPNMDGRSWTPG